MKRSNAEIDKVKTEKMKRKAQREGGLCKALCDLAYNSYRGNEFSHLWNQLTRIYGKEPDELKTAEEFWHPTLVKAVAALTDTEFAQEMEEITRMRMTGQFSQSMWRRSYRSSNFRYHVHHAIYELTACLRLYNYVQYTKELLFCEHSWLFGYEARLALQLKKKNPEITELVREAMIGDNGQIILTSKMLRAVVISDDEDLTDLMIQLLLAARQQEGLRQQILENADAGSARTLKKFLKVCVEEDLFRYSSVIRAFDTWSGLAFGDEKAAAVKKYAALALECLEDPACRESYLASGNNIEAYFALWAAACEEMAQTDQIIPVLLEDERKYRKVLGWLFVSRSDSSYYQMQTAVKYLKERDEELLAWIVSNLSCTREVLRSYFYGRDKWEVKAVKNADFPSDSAERRMLFDQLKDIAHFIGKKKRTFTGNPFDFSSIELSASSVLNCLMSLAGYDMDADMIDELTAFLPLMNADQRRAFYGNFLEPEENLTHRSYLRDALADRSIYIKELAVERLSICTLQEADLDALCASLRSKSSSLRKSVISILRKQKREQLEKIIEKMLDSGEEYQIQAGIELLLEWKEKEPALLERQKERLQRLKEKELSSQTSILLEQLHMDASGKGGAGATAYTSENGFGIYDPKLAAEFDKEPEAFSISGEGLAVFESDAPEGSGKLAESVESIESAGSADAKSVSEHSFRVAAPKTLLGKLMSRKGASSGGPISEKEIKALIPSLKEYTEVIDRMNQVFERHADYEYETENWDGSRRTVLFGDGGYSISIPADFDTRSGVKLEMIPFYEEFIDAMGIYARDVKRMIGMQYAAARYSGDHRWNEDRIEGWFAPFDKMWSVSGYHEACNERYSGRYYQITDIIAKTPQLFDDHDIFAEVMPMYRSIVSAIGEERLGQNYIKSQQNSRYVYYNRESSPMNHRLPGILRMFLKQSAESDEDFKEWFLLEHRLEALAGVNTFYGLTINDYFRACDRKIAPNDVLAKRLFTGKNAAGDIRTLTYPADRQGRQIYERYPWAKEFVTEIVLRIVDVEEKRGEMSTALTAVARSIGRFEGVSYFCSLLAALGKENFFRGYEYSSDTTKRAVLSRLLKRCYPAKEDTPEKMKALLDQTDIKEKRLAEAVMYAPQWAEMAEHVMGWKGLKCGVWFFHAHVNESFSAEKETEVAIYSPITPQQFNDGAFDKDWFFEAYDQLGEKRFQILYKSAKYITAGSNQHRRSQLYTDAVLGKLDAAELKKEIEAKRNQEKLRCYPLIPISKRSKNEALRRYEFIQKFQKESRQFGAQRRESEKKACNTAMENLAITMGFSDVNRMTWYFESEKMEEIRPFTEPQELDGVKVWLEIGADGDAELAVEKNGKRQKSVPKGLKKDETILSLKAMAKDLKEQKRRAKESLERAMSESTPFSVMELEKIANNPVVFPMFSSLVWTDGERSGFLKKAEKSEGSQEGAVLCLSGLSEEYPLSDADDSHGLPKSEIGADHRAASVSELRIAHPHDLLHSGEWSGWMHLLYERKIVQPFKQVFREYYPMTEDERQEKTISRRYAGHQVQPKKTVALLKTRGWTVDYEEGLQKVFYKENLIVRMYALADWFSPADIEAPTLETVRFFGRRDGRPAELSEIPPILFSEVMRDLDLVVSVAHVGGVDPEASHSTVEMRTAIASELVKLLRLSNVEFIGSHAKIHGTLGNYSVHMGSGVVHAEGTGMIAILPVHSQARGRIFLPFADDDPKTAEIMSKIILLAEDKKIKDPSILEQIV